MADWLELVALVADDHNSGTGDLSAIVRRAGTFEGKSPTADEAIDAFCLSVTAVIENRATVLGKYYPFSINGGVIRYGAKLEDALVPYVFCLCLAYLGEKYSTKTLKPRLMFEELAAFAAAQYVGGKHFIFGTSRSRDGGQTKRFTDAVTALCKFIGEGKAFRQQPGLNKKDDHVDVVVVKHFSDRATSKLVLFGQCASGVGWRSKTSELQPKTFWDQWIELSRVSDVLRSFFIPFPIDPKEWDYQARRAGLLFDRVRIAYWAAQSADFAGDISRFSTWINGCLTRLAKPKSKFVLAT